MPILLHSTIDNIMLCDFVAVKSLVFVQKLVLVKHQETLVKSEQNHVVFKLFVAIRVSFWKSISSTSSGNLEVELSVRYISLLKGVGRQS